jgi:hypothetical protein
VLVVCGGKTEQIYFNLFKQTFRFPLENINVTTTLETKNPLRVVEYAILMRQQKEYYNAVWCVFDKDAFTDFDDAIAHAGRHKIGVAFSNQAFEVWFINHFRLLESALHRNRYKDELGKLLVFPYDKSRETVTKTCGAILTEEKVKAAIANARLGYERHVTNTVPSRPSVFESCTTVYMLARSLLNWVE